MKERALIVDDDKDLLAILKRYLENHDIEVFTALNGTRALSAAAESRPDIIIADVDMPRMDGLTMCRRIKESDTLSSIPLIIMSGKKISETDMVSGYTFGADDYIAKPFSYPLLLAKIKAVIRRSSPGNQQEFFSKDGLEIDTKGRVAKLRTRTLKLTAKEFDLLTALVSNQGRLLSVSSLLESVWGYNTDDYNNYHTVEVHISNLRKKIGPFAKRITAVQGHGYKFE
jgi:Response regulators consisting of a CheY-like receiver domain and a winged-helix DNA-binding domain